MRYVPSCIICYAPKTKVGDGWGPCESDTCRKLRADSEARVVKGPYFCIERLKESNISGQSKYEVEREIVDLAAAEGRTIERA